MSRIDLDAIRRALSDPREVAACLGRLKGLKRQAGGGVMIACVAHDDRGRPNLSLTVGGDGTIRARCFSCGFSGNVFHLVAASAGLDIDREFPAVVAKAAELACVSPTERAISIHTAIREAFRPEPEPRLDVGTFAAMMHVLAHLGRLDGLGLSEGPTRYLARRGLLADAVRDGWFAIGSHVGTLLADAFGACVVAKTGLVDRSGALKFTTHTLAIPWRDRSGRMDTVQRRRVDASPERKYVFPDRRGALYPYGIDRLDAAPLAEVVIVEGAIDVLARRRIDSRTVLGVPGVGWAPADGWAPIVAGRIVRVSFDADSAGDRGAEQFGEKLYEAGATEVLRERLRAAKDWAECLEHGPTNGEA